MASELSRWVLLLAIVSVPLAGIFFTTPAAAQAGLPGETIRGVDAVFHDIGEEGPGCAVGVVQDQELMYGKGIGLANLDYRLPITIRSNFYLGSVGKQFTAAAVLHAVREGHISLEDPIQKWVPEILEYDRIVTIRNLIHHTSGIRDYLALWDMSGVRGDDVHTDQEVLDLLARQKAPNFPAGDQYMYSNSGYFLLAKIVERATGQSFREYAEANLLRPLGMDHTYILDDRSQVMDQRVVGYESTGNGYRMAHLWNFDKIGSGGVYSSIEDMVHWDRNYYTDEVGGPGFTEALLEPGVLANGDTLPYAFGLTHGQYRGLRTVGHGGALAGFRSELLRFPEEQTTILVLCNFPTSDPGSRARQVADVVLADRLEEQPENQGDPGEPGAEVVSATETARVELTVQELDAFVGHWRASMGIEVELRREDDRLIFIQDGSQTPVTILAEDRLRLEAVDVDMTTTRMEDGRWTFMDVVQGGTEFTAERVEPATGERSGDYAKLVGDYYSQELNAIYTLFEGETGLMLRIPQDREMRVYLGENGQVRAPFGTLELHRDGDTIVGFTVNAGRVRGVAFERVEEGEGGAL